MRKRAYQPRSRADRPHAKWPHSMRIDSREVSGGKPYGFAKQALKLIGASTTQIHMSLDNSGRPVIAFANANLLRDYEFARMKIERCIHIARPVIEIGEVRQKEQIRFAEMHGRVLVHAEDLVSFLERGPGEETEIREVTNADLRPA